MRFEPVTYMRWAKARMGCTPWFLAGSSVPNIDIESFGLSIDDLHLRQRSPDGDRALIERIAEFYGARPEEVLISHGASLAVTLFIAALVEPGEQVLAETPGYRPLADAARLLGADVVEVARRFEDGYALDPDRWIAAFTPRTKLIMLTNLHNPSGVACDAASLRYLAEAAGRRGVHLLVDEVYLEALAPIRERSVYHLSEGAIAVNSLSKVYGLAGVRVGWALAPETLVRRAHQINDYFAIETSCVADAIALKAFANHPMLISRTQRFASEGWEIVSRWLAERPEFKCVAPSAGTICFPKLRDGLSVDQFVDHACDRHGVLVVPGRFFGSPAHVRLGFGMQPNILRQSLDRLGQSFDEVSSTT